MCVENGRCRGLSAVSPAGLLHGLAHTRTTHWKRSRSALEALQTTHAGLLLDLKRSRSSVRNARADEAILRADVAADVEVERGDQTVTKCRFAF